MADFDDRDSTGRFSKVTAMNPAKQVLVEAHLEYLALLEEAKACGLAFRSEGDITSLRKAQVALVNASAALNKMAKEIQPL